jgi:acyl carrier protein
METTFMRLATILTRDYKLAPERISGGAYLEGLGIDSLATVELLWTLEEEFSIKLPPEPGELSTVDDVVHLLDELMRKQGAAGLQAATPRSTDSGSFLQAR